ncbi:hypothetical protein MD484_g6477, partial [Candolleomyces efflorescens]
MALFQNISIDQLLSSWAANAGPTEDEKIAYANAVSEILDDSEMVKKFIENVNQVGVWANEIDDAFDKVTRVFADMVSKYGGSLPEIKNFNNEWIGYKERWVSHLLLSRDVASEHSAILKRFDKVYLDMVESIQTVQDVKDVVLELQVFIDEDHDRSQEMSAGFLSLKRDIQYFVPRLDEWIETTGQELAEDAKRLQREIESLNSQIQVMDSKIEEATTALIACGACLCVRMVPMRMTGSLTHFQILGIIVAGSVLAAYQAEKDDLLEQLSGKERELAIVNQTQKDLANLQTEFDGVKPDIDLICQRLVLFAEIWSSVRSQAVQIQEALKGATSAPTDMGFKSSVKLARAMCSPLEAGLEKYATTLENRQKEKEGKN